MSENPAFTPDEARSLLAFLDRAPINGHKERIAMNHLVNKIVPFIPKEELEGHPDQTEGTGDEATGD